jgi:glycosyltransferase involved in cell wall biosynthesis
MHILHVIDTLRPGGAQRALLEIANQTCALGATVSVCVTRDGLDMAEKLNPAIRVCVLERTRRFDWPAMRRFADWVETQHADVIHSHGRTTFCFLAYLRSLGLIHRPLLMHDHNGRVERADSAPLWFRAWAAKHVAHYVGVCAAMEGWAAGAGIPQANRSLIPCALDLCSGGWNGDAHPDDSGTNAVDPDACDPRKEFAVPPGVLLGICLGGVRPQKGIDTLLAAVARSRRRGAFRIVVAGGVREPGYWKHCLRETKRLGLENEILFAGERTGIDGWLGRFDFAVHAARCESGPLVVIEHLAAGLPLVCSRVGGIARRAEELGVQQFVPPEDPAALAAAIDALVAATPDERAARARHGTQIARRYFDIRTVMPAWRRVYEKVSGKPFPSRHTAAA